MLQPLSEVQSRVLLAQVTADDDGPGLPDSTRDDMVATAGGNPLYLEQLARHLQEQPGSPASFPPALHGLLASRLDLLPQEERMLLERGAIEGDIFHLESVAAGLGLRTSAELTSPGLDRALDSLIRRDLVVPVAGGGLGGLRPSGSGTG